MCKPREPFVENHNLHRNVGPSGRSTLEISTNRGNKTGASVGPTPQPGARRAGPTPSSSRSRPAPAKLRAARALRRGPESATSTTYPGGARAAAPTRKERRSEELGPASSGGAVPAPAGSPSRGGKIAGRGARPAGRERLPPKVKG